MCEKGRGIKADYILFVSSILSRTKITKPAIMIHKPKDNQANLPKSNSDHILMQSAEYAKP